VKFGFPMAVATSFLAWGAIDFKPGYSKAQFAKAQDAVKWSTDYFIKAHTGKNEFYAQVGLGKEEHRIWNRPEDLLKNKQRIGQQVNETHPGSDVVGATAAAMAAGSILFKETDPAYSDELIQHAKELYAFGNKFKGRYSDVLPDANVFYQSTEYRDDLAWGAIWLHLATDDKSYLKEAKKHMNSLMDDEFASLNGNAVDWNNVAQPACLLLYRVTNDNKYAMCVEEYVEKWSKRQSSTKNGLSYIPQVDESTSLRDSANSAMLALAYGKELSAKGRSLTKRWTYECWALLQVRYMLGDGGRSYVTGYGKNPPTHVHHRGSTCPDAPATCNWDTFRSQVPNRHTLVGGLVGGPDIHDDFYDDRKNVKQSEVALDFNAGFTGALARLARIRSNNGFSQCYHGDGVFDFFRVIDLPN